MAARLSALRACRPPEKISGTRFCYRLSRPQGHSAAGWIKSIANSNDLLVNRTRYWNEILASIVSGNLLCSTLTSVASMHVFSMFRPKWQIILNSTVMSCISDVSRLLLTDSWSQQSTSAAKGFVNVDVYFLFPPLFHCFLPFLVVCVWNKTASLVSCRLKRTESKLLS
jgi:hypothetical protein